MPSAIILVSTSIGVETHILKRLRLNAGVQEVFYVQGVYDIVVKVKTETFDTLRDCIAKIKESLPKIQDITTMLVVERSVFSNRQEKLP